MVSIIIVNYNGIHHLKRCLPALFKTRYDSFEVIVVDNGSRDESCSWIREHYPQVRLYPLSSNVGFGRANELGAQKARGRYIAFLNSDTVVTVSWLAPMVRVLRKRPRVMAVCSLLCLLETPHLLNAGGGGMSFLGYGYDRFFRCPKKAFLDRYKNRETLPVFFPTAAAMLMRRDDFDALGGFDSAFFMYHEDVDLGWRIWLRGGEVRVCIHSVVYHLFGGTTRREQNESWRSRLGMRHNIRALIKCYRKRRVLRVLYRHLSLWIRRRAFAEMAEVLAWNLMRLPVTLKERGHIQRRRKIADETLLDRGLIAKSDYPSPPPVSQVGQPADMASWTVCSPELVLGKESSVGRLGAGWYAPEVAHGKLSRLICGRAVCFLKVAPHGRGRLTGACLLPEAFQGHGVYRVEIACNRSRTQVETGAVGEWKEWSMPVQADADGVLKIVFDSPLWSPACRYDWPDYRWFGCAVDRVVFEDAEESSNLSDPGWKPEDISVIIPTFNRWATLARALSALAAQTISGFQVIVVDDGSTDDTWEAMHRWKAANPNLCFRLDMARQANLLQGRARNRGLKMARGRLAMFIGDDILPAPDCLAHHLDAHQKWNAHGDAAVLGFTDWDRETVQTTRFLEFINSDGPQFGYGHLKEGDDVPFTCFYTSHISLPLKTLGNEPFSPLFTAYGWEDAEVGYRMTRQGMRIVYCPGARAAHAHPMTLTSFCRRQEQVGESLEMLLKIHPEMMDSPFMPKQDYPLFSMLGGALLPWVLPLLNALDQNINRPWPIGSYRALARMSFLRGWRNSRK